MLNRSHAALVDGSDANDVAGDHTSEQQCIAAATLVSDFAAKNAKDAKKKNEEIVSLLLGVLGG